MACQVDGRRTVFAIGTRIGKSMQIDTFDDPVLVRSDPYMHLHLVSWRRSGKTLFSAENQLAGLLQPVTDKSRIYFRYCRLLGTETSPHSRLGNPDHRFRDVQRTGDDMPDMENDLGGRSDMQTSVRIDLAVSRKRLHVTLLRRLGMIGSVYDVTASAQHFIDVAHGAGAAGDEVSFYIRSHIHQDLPVVFRMNDRLVVKSFLEIKHGIQYFVFHIDQLHGLIDCLFVVSDNDRHDISDIAHMTVDDQSVIWRKLRKSRSGYRISFLILIDILVGKNGFYAFQRERLGGIDILDDRIGVRRS